MRRLFLLLPLTLLIACAPRLSQHSDHAGTAALNCTGTREGTLTKVGFRLSANLNAQTGEAAGVLTEASGKAFRVYGTGVKDGTATNLILSVTDHTESYAGVDLIVRKARLGYFSNSQSTLSGVLSGNAFTGRQKAGINNYEVKMECARS